MKDRENIFFFNDTATTEIYTLSLHDALPILPGLPHAHNARRADDRHDHRRGTESRPSVRRAWRGRDRKSTRLNSSHANISYAVFCLKKKTTLCFPILRHPAICLSTPHSSGSV